MKYGLNDTTIEQIRAVLSHYPQVERAVLYGSRARGNARIGSDIDLTLIGGDDLDRSILGKIFDELDDLLLPYTFDLSLFSMISDPDVRAEIQRTGVVFYERRADPCLKES
jgi:predicted nucleotidyltransferase